MKVIWSPLAIERAYEATAYIARDKPGAAVTWIEGLFKATDRLELFPESGRVVEDIGLPNYREIVYRSHRIIYRVEESRVSILTVRHFARMLDKAEIGLDEE